MFYFAVACRQITTSIRASEGNDQSASEIPSRGSLPTITKKSCLKLNRMIDDFHLKLGRHDEGTGRTTPVDKGDRVKAKDMATLEDGALCTRMVEGSENNNVVTLFPTIAAPYKAFEKGGRHTGSPVALTCVCCGREGGKGHGRRCSHKYRRCGFCRVEEVHRVLSTAHSKRGNHVPAEIKVR